MYWFVGPIRFIVGTGDVVPTIFIDSTDGVVPVSDYWNGFCWRWWIVNVLGPRDALSLWGVIGGWTSAMEIRIG